MAVLTLIACQEEAQVPTGTTPADDHNCTPRVRAFVERASTGQRDGEGTITADSSEWYVEAGLNFSFTNLAVDYNDSQVDSVSYTIPLNEGSASEADAAAAYNALGVLINESNVADESHVVIVDVTSQNTGTTLVLTAAYVVGSGYDKVSTPHTVLMTIGRGEAKVPTAAAAPIRRRVLVPTRRYKHASTPRSIQPTPTCTW